MKCFVIQLSFRNGFEIHSLVIYCIQLLCFLKIRQVFNLSYIYPNHMLQLKILQQKVIYEQKVVFCNSVLCYTNGKALNFPFFPHFGLLGSIGFIIELFFQPAGNSIAEEKCCLSTPDFFR